MDWKERVVEMGVLTKSDDEQGLKGTAKALDLADVLWAAWSEDGRTPTIRVIRGRDLTGDDLKHGVMLVENEVVALDLAESLGDQIGLKEDGKTLDVPEPAVPPHLIRMIQSDPVLLFDGTPMNFDWQVEDA